MLKALSGYKTYIVATLIAILSAARFLGYVDEPTFQSLFALLTGGGIAALRAGVKKS